MTLTSILPTLRATIPDPLVIDRWPEWTHPTTTDVIVSGVSLLRLGRASTQHSAPFVLPDRTTLTLPEDAAAGDLVAIPCRGAVCRRQLRSNASQ